MRPGDEITLETRDGLDGQLTRDSSHADVLALDLGLGHPLTGPVYVDGAEPGDVVDIEFVAYETADFGVTAVIPGFGYLADMFTDPYLVTWEIAGGNGALAGAPGRHRAGRPVCRRHRRRAVARADGRRSRSASRRSRMQAPPLPTACRRRRSLPLREPACARFRHGRSAATSTSASSSRARASRFRFTSKGRSSRSETSTSPRATARSAAPASRSRAR